MKNYKDILISPETTILKTIELVDASSLQIALVIDENNRLIGTVCDGDVRRGILKGIQLSESVQKIMFTTPTVVKSNAGRDSVLAVMKAKQLRQIPVVDDEYHVVGLEVWSELLEVHSLENWVVLMAGGLGSRLGHLTKDCPKPLLKVGNKPILETILDGCKEVGLTKFFIAVNYKADMIKKYFGDGSRFGIDIQYLCEPEKMGTAGALGLLPEKPNHPLLVMNADVLTKVNLNQLLGFHAEHNASATMCVREYEFQVPYGVVKVDNHRLTAIEEKPVQRFLVSAGIYVLNSEVLSYIPKGKSLDMPNVFEKLIDVGSETAVFPIREYWLDIGRINDFERANGDYDEVFR